jgi:hypothetical protein
MAVPKMAAREQVEVVARIRSVIQAAKNSFRCDKLAKW